MQTTDLDSSTRPGKWQKRGIQPEVAPTRKSLLVSLHELASSIREETDPQRKSEMKAQYAAETKALDALTCDPTSTALKETLAEIADCFTPIVDPPASIAEEIEMPESMNREQWRQVHRRILQCHRFANKWIAKSRRFASERWGDEFVEKEEAQMELALGIEPRPVIEDGKQTEKDIALVDSIGRTFARLTKEAGDWRQWSPDKARHALDVLAPVDAMIQELKGRSA